MKKDANRYTIRFNPNDPRHQQTMKALETAGRRKATLIADAVSEYLMRYGGYGVTASLSSTAALIHPLIENDLPSPITEKEADEKYTKSSKNISVSEKYDDEMLDAVLGGLSVFMG